MSNTFEVELRFENPGAALKEGILAEAKIDFLQVPEALVIPLKAIRVTDAGPRVLIVKNENGRSVARVRDIRPVSIHNDQILVRGGLAPHDQLIISGGKGVVDGEEVHVVDGENDARTAAGAGRKGATQGAETPE
jgi:hypothetical protein